MNKIHTPLAQNKPSFGEQYLQGIKKDSGKASVKDIRTGLLSEWDKNIFELIEKTREIIKSERFYVSVTTKREYLAPHTIRNYFESKYHCPTPQFEQVVYRIKENSNDWQLMWVIPNKEACNYLIFHRHRIPLDEHALLGYVLEFFQGKLDQRAQKENGEIIEKLDT